MLTRAIPAALPDSLKPLVQLLRAAPSKNACLKLAYEALTQRYHGDSIKTVTRFWQLFPRSIDTLSYREGFLHCTNFNWLLRSLLVHSGHFQESDMETRWTLYHGFSPHQHVRVHTETSWITVDAWGQRYGVPLGEYAH